MNAITERHDAMIRSYFEGQCSQDEALALLSWIAESEEHRDYFESYKEVWQLTSFTMPTNIDVEAALDAVNMRIDAEEAQSKTVEMPWLKRNYKYVSGIAAALIVALFLGFLVSKPFSQTVTLASNDWNTETPYLLPDGTSVSFAGESEITFPKQFANDGREVNFEGKAYFDVTKDEAKPFVIHCGNLDIEVLGTSFLLDASDERYVVDLYSGKVGMTSFDKKGHQLAYVELLPGERGVWNVAEGGNLKSMTYAEVKDEELKKDHVLDFNDVSLSTIVETLEYIYDIKVDLPEAYRQEKLTMRFSSEDSVGEVIETIATVFGLEVSKSGDTYKIR